jgi:hypothetical protein
MSISIIDLFMSIPNKIGKRSDGIKMKPESASNGGQQRRSWFTQSSRFASSSQVIQHDPFLLPQGVRIPMKSATDSD